MNLKNFKRIFAETFFPNDFTCDICGGESFGSNLCADCKKSVIFNDAAACPVCGRRTVRPEICLECKAVVPAYKKGVSALVYENGAVILIQKYKNGAAYLKEYFSALIYDKLNGLPSFDAIVYVPMTKKALKKRGYNQSLLLAKCLSEKLNAPVIKDALEKTKDTAEQKTLTLKQREQNLNGCFAVKNPEAVKDKILLLTDDVLTTGTTANVLTVKLLAAGAKAVYFASVAAVEYKIKKEENASDIKPVSNKKRGGKI